MKIGSQTINALGLTENSVICESLYFVGLLGYMLDLITKVHIVYLLLLWLSTLYMYRLVLDSLHSLSLACTTCSPKIVGCYNCQ